MVQDWLFLVLRYAVSRDAGDRQAILDQAMKMDTLGGTRDREAFQFFRSYSERLCTAIAAPDMPDRRQVIMAHVRRIGQRPLQQALLLACRLELRETAFPGSGRKSGRSGLWRGLQGR
jgi:hypothetical protein